MSKGHLISLLMVLTVAVACSSGTPEDGGTGAQSSGTPISQGGSSGNPGSSSSNRDSAGTEVSSIPSDVTQPPTVPPPTEVICGNSNVESGEQCDDGNVISGDGCNSVCKSENCGDGIVQSDLNEECDGTNLNGSSCATFGYSLGSLSCGGTCKFDKTGCSNPIPAPVCGNGVKETGEQCDDGNTFNWDGCSSACQAEPSPTIGTNFLTSENLWNSKKQTMGSVTFGAADVASADNAVVALMFPGVPGQGSTYKTGPANATQISTKQLVSFGTYRTRVKFATCAATEEVVNGVFLYSYGGDTNANGITDNNEIDFEVLCGEPNILYLTTWTDYDVNGGVEVFLKVTRAVDMTTGKIYQTKPGFEGSYGNMAQVATIPDAVISNFLVSGAYYELGLDYQSSYLRFTIMNNGKEVTLWDYTDSKYIPQNPMSFMFNVWHTDSHWWVGGNANYPANNALMSVDYFKYWAN